MYASKRLDVKRKGVRWPVITIVSYQPLVHVKYLSAIWTLTHADCRDGYFGENCERHCSDTCVGPCNKVTGSCTTCVRGWSGDFCETVGKGKTRFTVMHK